MNELHPAPTPTTAPTPRSVALARAAATAAGTLILLVGTPIALTIFIGNPLPSHVSWQAVALLATRPDTSGELFLRTLAIAGWIAWATLVISVILEVIARASRRPVPHLGRAFSLQQQVAAGLIGALAVLFLSPASLATAAVPAPSPVSGTALAASALAQEPSASTERAAGPTTEAAGHAGGQQEVGGPDPAAPTAPVEAAAYTVQAGDSLWSIAEAHLGDGNRYDEIAALNTGVVQADGHHLDEGHWLRPGWVLQLPAGAHPAPQTTNPADDTTDAGAAGAVDGHVVAAGESIWSIADTAAGPDASTQQVADLAQRIADESRDITQPSGHRLHDPDLIQPGWHLDGLTPASAGPTPQAPAAETAPTPQTVTPPPAEQAAPVPAPEAAAPTASQAAPPEAAPAVPSATPSATPSMTPSMTPSVTSSTTPSAATPQPNTASTSDEADDEATWPLRTVGGIGALLAAGLLGLLAARRARQQRRRLPGQRIAMPHLDDEITELELRAVENPRALERVNTALRGLALWLHQNNQPLPALTFARLAADRFQLHLDEPTHLPHPWIATTDPTIWALTCDPDDPHPIDTPALADGTVPNAGQLAEVPAPYPSLTVIGQDLEGTHILLDLEQLIALSITGDANRSEQVLRALAIELAASVWADDLRVTLVGCCPELPEALGSLRIRHLPDVEELLRDLEGHIRSTNAALQQQGLEDVQQARVQHQATDVTAPEIVLLAQPVSDGQRDRLDAVLNDHPRLGLAAVTTGAVDLDSWTLSLDEQPTDGEVTATLQELSLRVIPQRVDDQEYASILRMLHATGQPAADVHREQMPAEQHPDALPSPALLVHNVIDLRDEPTDLGTDLNISAAEDADDVEVAVLEDQEDERGDEPVVDEFTDDRGTEKVDELVEVDGPTAGSSGREDAETSGHAEEAVGEGTSATDGGLMEADPVKETLTGESAGPHALQDNATDAAEATVTRLHPPLLRVLGTVDVINAHGEEPAERGRVARGLELAILIAFFPGLDHRGIDDKLSPNKPLTTSTRNRYSWAIRKLLGTDENGDNFVPNFNEIPGFRYTLHPAVRTDWQLFQDLVAQGSTASVLKALRMVRGAPFSGIDPRRYVWAQGLQQEIVSTIVDVAYTLATRALNAGQPGLAREAAALGRLAEPGSQVLWRATLRADHMLRDHQALTEHADRVSETNDDDLEPETTQLLRDLLQGPLLPASAQ
ncbi:LysM peptidoglycan-binding domain-containing protein [Kineococcus sp. SYSU DK003]|uniref:LysM peptidoglycan-binding domain-containing protein n=1 Tax=Kineococcus sp. SYSU DK003 TaxID=3383124 RepID=UPI003D7E043B